MEEQFSEKQGLTPQGKYFLRLFHTIINKNMNRKEALICCFNKGASKKHYDHPNYTSVSLSLSLSLSLSFCKGSFNWIKVFLFLLAFCRSSAFQCNWMNLQPMSQESQTYVHPTYIH